MKKHTPTTEEILHLVGLVYACATDPSRVNELLRAFNEQVGGETAQIFTRNSITGLVQHWHSSDAPGESANQDYLSQWGASDPRAQLLGSLPAGEVLRCHQHFDEKFVSASRFYQDYLIPNGLRWSLAGMHHSGPGLATGIAAARAADAPPFEDGTADTLRQLLPHFQRAWAISSRFGQQAAAVRSATDMLKMLPAPWLFTDQAGRCIEANESFTQALDALSLRLVTGRVRFAQPEAQSRWKTALLETQATALGRTMPFTAPGGKEWKLHLVPWQPLVPGADALDKQLILVMFDERVAEVQPHSDFMAGRARLTRAEMEVLASLLKGLPAKAIASRRSASVHTVRSQIMAILDKTGYSSQRELIASFGASTLPNSAFAGSTFQ